MNSVGCLVRNFYGRNASKRDMLISMIQKREVVTGKYLGALVLPPKKNERVISDQLIVADPVADLNFASMYLHVMITMNISKETLVDIDSTDPDLALNFG